MYVILLCMCVSLSAAEIGFIRNILGALTI